MPIALPAPSTPEPGSAEVLRSQGSAYVTAALGQNRIHVIGPQAVPARALEHAITGAENLSDAVRRIQAAYYVAGYPAVRVVYALAQPDLYVQVALGKVTRVQAPARYQAYFDGITQDDPLSDAALERRRVFASLHADRAGQSAIPAYRPDGDGSVLRIEPNDQGPGRSAMGAGFGNPGNRFVGRHFLDWFATHSFTTGDEIRASGRHGMEGLDSRGSSDGYHEPSLGWSKVTPWGVFGAQGRYAMYQQRLDLADIGEVKLDGNIREAELGWTGVLHSDFVARWGVGAQIDYMRKNVDTTFEDPVSGDHVLLQRQEYGSAELSTEYARILRPFDIPLEVSAGLVARHGLGEDEREVPTVGADLGYRLLRPSLNAKLPLGERLTLRLAAIAQWSDDTLPEQQQWVMGGVGNVEAYLPGVASGDSGGLARFQVETRSVEIAGIAVVPRLFVEYGYARLENPFEGQSGATQSLADGGAALAFTRGPIEAAISYAESFAENQVTTEALRDADANAFFRVAVRF